LALNICMNTQTNTQITIQDLVEIKDMIDLACSRGAYRGAEVRAVGEIYEKISAFLDAVIVQSQSQAQSDSEQRSVE